MEFFIPDDHVVQYFHAEGGAGVDETSGEDAVFIAGDSFSRRMVVDTHDRCGEML